MNLILPAILVIGGLLALGKGAFSAEKLSVSLTAARIRKMTWSSLELRLDFDLVNLSPASAVFNNTIVDIYYMKPGSNGTREPRYITRAILNQSITVGANSTTPLKDVSVKFPYSALLNNASILTDDDRTFRALISGSVGSQKFTFTKDFKPNADN